MKKLRSYEKNKMLYPDRCMMKWQGMLLADHTEAMKENVNQLKEKTKKEPPKDSS